MLKLSRTGWNNVIIISVMSFILLINTTFKHKFSEEEGVVEGEQPIIMENAVILTLSVNDFFKVERSGRVWRSTSKTMKEHALEQMMMAWQQRSGIVMETAPEVDSQMALTVKIELANQAQPINLALYTTDTELLLFQIESKRWLRLPLPIFAQLIPDAVFSGE